MAEMLLGTRLQNLYSSELFRVPIAVTTALQVRYTGTQKDVGALTSYRSSQEQISRADPPILICE